MSPAGHPRPGFFMPDQLLTVIAGGPDTGKSLVAELLVREKGYTLVARDTIRAALINPPDEWAITLMMVEMAQVALEAGRSVLTVSQNLDPADRKRWTDLAEANRVPLRWIGCEVANGQSG